MRPIVLLSLMALTSCTGLSGHESTAPSAIDTDRALAAQFAEALDIALARSAAAPAVRRKTK